MLASDGRSETGRLWEDSVGLPCMPTIFRGFEKDLPKSGEFLLPVRIMVPLLHPSSWFSVLLASGVLSVDADHGGSGMTISSSLSLYETRR